MMNQKADKILRELKENYQKIAEDFSETRSQEWPEFSSLIPYIPNGSKVLDLGCGNGRFFGFLEKVEKVVDYTGVDFTPGLLSIAKKKYPQQEFIEQDITKLDLSRMYDRIVCIAAFHHIPSRKLRKKALRLMMDHLEDKGMLFISVWNLWQWRYRRYFFKSLLSFFGSLFHHDPRDLYIPFGKGKIPRYYHAFLPYEIRRLLHEEHLIIEHSEVSRHNWLFICKKNLLRSQKTPIFVRERKFSPELRKSSALATSKTPL